MKTLKTLRLALLTLMTITALSCSSHSRIKGTASDRTGTNGATNGTGKVAKGL